MEVLPRGECELSSGVTLQKCAWGPALEGKLSLLFMEAVVQVQPCTQAHPVANPLETQVLLVT